MTNLSIELVLKGDHEERVFKIDQTETVIGRGKLFEINDKKVSRQHALLVVANGKVTLKSTHSNPCFVNLVKQNKKILLKQNVSLCLEDGDMFSLLPDDYTFQVKVAETSTQSNVDTEVHVPESDVIFAVDTKTKSNNDIINNDCNDNNPIMISKSSENDLKCFNSMKSKLTKIFPETSQSTSACGDSFIKPKRSLTTKRKLPQWMVAKNEVSQPHCSNKKNIKKNSSVSSSSASCSSNKKRLKKNEESVNPELIMQSKSEKCDSTNDILVPCSINSDVEKESMLRNAPSNIYNNEQKEADFCCTETGINSLFMENGKKKVIDNVVDMKAATESNHCVLQFNKTPVSSTNASNLICDNLLDATPANNNNKSNYSEDSHNGACNYSPTTREPCAYGKSCYRKNPVHFHEFSHPGDNDYFSFSSSDENDDRPECEYGLQCYRKNPTHKKMFKHTRRVPPKRTVTATTRTQDSSSDDYDLEDSFIDDDDDESDWTPTQNSAAKDKESSSDTDVEDIKGLVSSAKKFTKNKKLWKT